VSTDSPRSPEDGSSPIHLCVWSHRNIRQIHFMRTSRSAGDISGHSVPLIARIAAVIESVLYCCRTWFSRAGICATCVSRKWRRVGQRHFGVPRRPGTVLARVNAYLS
jgi:hypothetical protein